MISGKAQGLGQGLRVVFWEMCVGAFCFVMVFSLSDGSAPVLPAS